MPLNVSAVLRRKKMDFFCSRTQTQETAALKPSRRTAAVVLVPFLLPVPVAMQPPVSL